MGIKTKSIIMIITIGENYYGKQKEIRLLYAAVDG